MSIKFVQSGKEFTITDTPSDPQTITLTPGDFFTYSADVLSTQLTEPVDNDLFTYQSGIYDFLGNTIIFGATSYTSPVGGFTGLFDITHENITIKNLNIKVEIEDSSITGYLLVDRDDTYPSITIDNCHLVFNLTTVFTDAPGLCGQYMYGLVNRCSMTYLDAKPVNFGGWICADNAATDGDLTVTNCFSTGDIGTNAGGIVGFCCTSLTIHANCTIRNCYNTGDVGNEAGGICGYESCYAVADNYKATLLIENCYNTGALAEVDSAGIIGINSCYSSGSNVVADLTIRDCYNTAEIAGSTAAGLVGFDSVQSEDGISTAKILNCYNTGEISGTGASGIGTVTYMSLSGTGELLVTNCYNSGLISGDDAGGILGYNAGYAEGGTCDVTIRNCYNSGNITGDNSGGIVGAEACFSDGGGTVTTLNIISCFNIGVVTGTSAAGICGNNVSIASSLGVSSTFIESCYSTSSSLCSTVSPNTGGAVSINNSMILSAPNSQYGVGDLYQSFGDGSIDITSSSYAAGVGPGNVTLQTLIDVPGSLYDKTRRCYASSIGVTTPILSAFLNCEIWSKDDRCITKFAPLLEESCSHPEPEPEPVETSTGLSTDQIAGITIGSILVVMIIFLTYVQINA